MYLVVCKCPRDNKILKFGADKICWEFWQSRTSFVNLVCRVPNSLGQTNIKSNVLYLNNWKQTVSSIVSKIPLCYQLVLLSMLQGLEHSVIKKSNSLVINLLELPVYLIPYYSIMSTVQVFAFLQEEILSCTASRALLHSSSGSKLRILTWNFAWVTTFLCLMTSKVGLHKLLIFVNRGFKIAFLVTT